MTNLQNRIPVAVLGATGMVGQRFIPVLHALGQTLGTPARVILAVHLIAARKQPIHVVYAPAPGIHTHQGPLALALVQRQGLPSPSLVAARCHYFGQNLGT
jgi:hypothetical protein